MACAEVVFGVDTGRRRPARRRWHRRRGRAGGHPGPPTSSARPATGGWAVRRRICRDSDRSSSSAPFN